ncbi:ABC transporter substrate-binding protein [Halomonas chromatireducens]|uniref:Putative thiamine biosynthesis protein n=1 Tax=Halomonas chromatireducens TaxID=507626 RepID=A0A109ULX2_9GAMM|nr:ABC transporter substrate-binding protein [Halomonas chromatireducens]AMD01179.1 Putative thiamine biosynthesis protein [Halomonas chromatireducens]
MAKPYRWFALRVLAPLVVSLSLTPLPLIADSSSPPSAALDAPPLSLETEVTIPPSAFYRAEALAQDQQPPQLQLPPLIEGPSFIELFLPKTPASIEEAEDAEIPSVTSTPAEPIVPPPLISLEITLDWYLNLQHAALLVAREKGMFLRRGLDVTLVSPADPNVPAKLLAAGRTDLALGRQPQLHLLANKGQPLVRVATLIGTPMAGLLLRAPLVGDNGELSLEGIHLGYTDLDGRDILLSRLLANVLTLEKGLDLVDARDVHYSARDTIREGVVDGVMINHRFLLPRQLLDEGVASHFLSVEEHGIPSHDGLILMANRDKLNGNKREAIRSLISAIEEATLWIFNHPERAWELLATAEPALDDPATREAWELIYPRLSLQPAAVDQGRYYRFEQYLLNAGVFDTTTPLERLAIDLGAPNP